MKKKKKNTYSSTVDFFQKSFSHHEQILNPVGTREVTRSASENVEFPEVWPQSWIFWQKLKM